MAEGRHAADGEARRLAHLVTACLPDADAELGRVDATVAGAEAEQRAVVVTNTSVFTIWPTPTPTAAAAS